MFHRNLKRLSAGKKVSFPCAKAVYQETQLWGHSRKWQKPKQPPKRVFYLNPHLMYQPKTVHQPEVCDKFFSTYPQSAVWPKANRQDAGRSVG